MSLEIYDPDTPLDCEQSAKEGEIHDALNNLMRACAEAGAPVLVNLVYKREIGDGKVVREKCFTAAASGENDGTITTSQRAMDMVAQDDTVARCVIAADETAVRMSELLSEAVSKSATKH